MFSCILRGAQQSRLCIFSRLRTGTQRTAYHRGFTSTRFRSARYIRFEEPPESQKPESQKPSLKWDPVAMSFGGAVVLGIAYFISHLEQVSETGRWRFMNTTPWIEANLAKMAHDEVRQKFRHSILPPSHPLTRHVRRVVSGILSASNLGHLSGDADLPHMSPIPGMDTWSIDTDSGASMEPAYGPSMEWDVIVVNNEREINAMATPGVVIVFTGILPVCKDEQGLAAVLAHEIGHVVARHSAETISRLTIWIGFIFLLNLFGLDMLPGLSSSLRHYLLELPNSRKQEQEADLIGLRLMSRACYDPKAAPEMFHRLGIVEAKMGATRSPDFTRTHPSSEKRVKYLEEALPEGYAILAANPECSSQRDHFERFRNTVEMQFKANGEWELVD